MHTTINSTRGTQTAATITAAQWWQPRPVDAPWDLAHAAHLLRRTTVAFRVAQAKVVVEAGLEVAVDRLLAGEPLTGETDPTETAALDSVDRALKITATATGNPADLKMWWLHRLAAGTAPLHEKLTLFWHNHFATSIAKVNSVPQMLRQNELLRTSALQEFGPLLQAITRDPAMLVWLDSNTNRKRHPNENFAREIMELFSLGVGSYTEADIQEAARAFTGWHLRNGEFWLNTEQHDGRSKTVFGQAGKFNGEDIVRMCAEHPACATFLSTKLLKLLVEPTPSAELVQHAAERLRTHQLNLKPWLRELLLSTGFHDVTLRGRIIRPPAEFVLGTLQLLGNRVRYNRAAEVLAELGQDVFAPPSVKGWDGHKQWITTATLLHRSRFVQAAISTDDAGQRDNTTLSKLTPQELTTCWLGASPPEGALPKLPDDTSLTSEAGRNWLEAVWLMPESHLM